VITVRVIRSPTIMMFVPPQPQEECNANAMEKSAAKQALERLGPRHS